MIFSNAKKQSLSLILFVLVVSLGFIGHSQVDNLATPDTKRLYSTLLEMSGTGMLFGHQHTTAYGVEWEGDASRSDVNDVTGSFPAVYGWGFWDTGTEYKGAEEYTYLSQLMKEAHARGGVNTVVWHMENLLTGPHVEPGDGSWDPTGSAWDVSTPMSSILPGGDDHGALVEKLDTFAEFMLGLTDAKGNPIPVIFRPFHESNGSWFWWGTTCLTDAQFIELWQFTVTYLQDVKGVHNLLYAYSPDNCSGSTAEYLARYPGDDYVDVLGKDHYYSGDSAASYWLSVTNLLDDLAIIGNLGTVKGKVAALTEFGYRDSIDFGLSRCSDSNWFMTKFLTPLKSDPNASKISYCMAWRNANNAEYPGHYFVPYPGHPNEVDFVNFKNDPFTVFGDAMPNAYGTIIYVDAARPGGDGSSWANAYTDLQLAIDAAQVGDEVWVAAGTYKPTSWPNGGTTDLERHFSLKNGVTVFGGFAGTEDALDQRDVAANPTVLSGDFNSDDVVAGSGATLSITNNEENAYHIFFHSGLTLDASAVLDGVTITGGAASVNNGGGMYNSQCSPTVAKCTFIGNSAASYGGGMYNTTSSSPTVTDCTFTSNYAISKGGGVYNDGGSPALTNCTFSGNNASEGGGIYIYYNSPALTNCTFSGNSAAQGGGLYTYYCSPTLTNCTFSGNSASQDGGGIFAGSQSETTFTDCTFTGNVASNYGGGCYTGFSSTTTFTGCTLSNNLAIIFGGGLYTSSSSSPTLLTSCTLSENSAHYDGGAIYNASSVTLSGCAVISNSATRSGGGFYNAEFSNGGLTNCTFYKNSAFYGAGIYNLSYNSLDLINCTLSRNVALDSGGALYHISSSGSSSATLINSILWQNSAPHSPELRYSGNPAPVISDSVIEGGYEGGTNVIFGDPLLQPLRDNGGPALSMAIPSNSSAYGAGSLANSPAEDARGIMRDAFPDIGAYENNAPLLSWIEPVPSAIDFGQTVISCDSNVRQLVVRGSSLSNTISITSPAAFELSLDSQSWVNALDLIPTNGTVDKTIFIRFRPTVAGTRDDTISFVSGTVTAVANVTGSGSASYVVYVSNNGDDSDGSSWSKAYTDLQTGIDQAVQTGISGVEVWVKAGTYRPTGWPNLPGSTEPREMHFSLRNNVSVYGGFAGVESERSQRDIVANPTVLSGDFNNDDVVSGSGNSLSITNNAENAHHIFFHPEGTDLDNTALIDGFTISGGNTNGATFYFGAGMYNDHSSPVISNCSLLGNSTSSYGAGIYNSASMAAVKDCTFSGNKAINGGGVAILEYSSVAVTNCTFTDNYAHRGGGIYNSVSAVTVTDCVFADNDVYLFGGGVYIYDSPSVDLSNCTFTANAANQGGGLFIDQYSTVRVMSSTLSGNQASYGGGVYNASYSSVDLSNCSITGNSASKGGGVDNESYSSAVLTNCVLASNVGRGFHNSLSSATLTNCDIAANDGGIYNSDSSAILTNCTIRANTTNEIGGGLRNDYGSSATLTNCTITGNSASHGAGISNWNASTAILTNCTIFNNTASDSGGGISNYSDVTLTNSIVWQNTAVTDSEIYEYATSTNTVTHSVIGGGYSNGTYISNSDPLLQPLTDNGGPVRTMSLGIGSPAIDAGTLAGAPTTDARGVVRPQRGGIDIGAYEYDGGDWYTVTFSAGAGGSVSGQNPQYAVSGGDLVAVSAVPEGGYVFSGWSGDYVGTENPLTLANITMDMNITANFVDPSIADINLPAGISLIGYTGETSIDAQAAFQTLITNNQLSVVRWVDPANGQISELYHTTFPSPAWINEIGDLNLGHGYVIKTTSACTLSISGNKSTASVSHNLPAGYSIIGFNQETPVDAQSAFQPLINAGVLELVRWVDPANGQIKELYYTNFPSPAWVNEIGDLTEGQGYIIKLNTPHNGFTLP